MSPHSSRSESVQSIDRAIHILNCFSAEIQELALGEIAERTGLPKATTYRLLSALRKHQWIEQDERSSLYRLGFRLYALGAVVANQMDLRRSAVPIMHRLAEETKETVNLNTVDQGERICIELVEGAQGIRNFVKIGTRNSLLMGASGKVLLAHLPSAQAEEVLEQQCSTASAAELKLLRQELQDIHDQGYAVTYSDRLEGASGVSAPVWDRAGKLAVGLTVSGPVDRIRAEEPQIVRKLLAAANELSQRLGYVDAVVKKEL